MNDLLTVAELAALLRVSVKTARRWYLAGRRRRGRLVRLAVVRLGDGAAVRIERQAALAFVEELSGRPVRTPPAPDRAAHRAAARRLKRRLA